MSICPFVVAVAVAVDVGIAVDVANNEEQIALFAC